MGLLSKMREWVRKMLKPTTIKDFYKTDIAVSDTVLSKIEEWERMYKGNAPWVDNKEVYSLGLEQAIVREFANVTLNEMDCKVSNKRLDDIFKKATNDLNKNLQRALATGAMVIKPLGDDKVQFVPQSAFIPIEYDVNGRLIKVIFPETKQVSEQEYLTRLEYHDLDYEKGLTITNRAFKSNTPDTLGKEIPLESVSEWADLDPYINYPLMKKPAFGYYVNPIDNTIDNGHAGVSVFVNARHLIKLADTQFGRLEWEFESGQRRIDVDEQAVRQDEKGKEHIDKIYRSVDVENLFEEFSPALRQADFIEGLEEYKRSIEFSVGLSYGDISNPQTVDKTATEIKAAKKRKYNTVSAIQNNLKQCLEDLVYSLAFYNAMATQNYSFVCEFKDSILVDDETERTQDRQDVSMGAMPLWEYRMKWYGEDEKTAKAMTTDTTAEVLE